MFLAEKFSQRNNIKMINGIDAKFFKKQKGLLILIGIIVIISILSFFNHNNVPYLLPSKWQYISITDSTGQQLYSKNKNDFLVLSPQTNLFTDLIPSKNKYESGYWELDNSTLALHYNAENQTDSIVYQVVNGIPVLSLYQDGKPVTTINKAGIQATQQIINYEIVQCTEDSLIMTSYDKITYHFIKANIVTPEMTPANNGFSFSFSSVFRGLFGLLVIIGIAFLFSSNRKAISWRVVIIGLAIQFCLAIGILKVPFIQDIFESISTFFIVVLDFTRAGSDYLFGSLLDTEKSGYIFVFHILPTILFFAALTSVLFYLGIIQKVVFVLAYFLTKALRISGAESLSVAANIFIGQTESPLLIKPYLEDMNKSEILLVMIGGMATIAGGVLAAYIGFLGGTDPVMRLFWAKHLLTASIMAAPGAIVIAKILVPQTETVNTKVEIKMEKIGSNILDALSNGTAEGLKLAVNVGAMILVFIAFIAMFNYILDDYIGSVTGLNSFIADITDNQYNGLTLQFILGYMFSPIVWALGICKEDIALVGQLLGEKIIMTEFISYISLADMKTASGGAFGAFAEEKSIIMATYMLCGFANFASIGIQIGGIGALAPGKRKQLSKFGIKALIGGTLASLISATIVGILVG